MVKRFKDFLFESSSDYYFKVSSNGETYYLRKNGKNCGMFDLIELENNNFCQIDGIYLKPYKDKGILGDNIIYLFGISSYVKGVGVMLMSKVINESKRLGYDTIVLSVHPAEYVELSKLIDFYEHFGFRIFYGKRMIRPRKRHIILMYLKIK